MLRGNTDFSALGLNLLELYLHVKHASTGRGKPSFMFSDSQRNPENM